MRHVKRQKAVPRLQVDVLTKAGQARDGLLYEGLEGRLRETLVSAVAAGARHCFAVASDGRLFGWGQARTTESEKVDTLGLRLDANQCRPLMYDGLRISRPHLARG